MSTTRTLDTALSFPPLPAAIGGPTGAKRLDVAHGGEVDKSGATFTIAAGYSEWVAAVSTPGGRKDPTLFIGYNTKIVGNRVVSGEPSCVWALEADYENASFRAMEQYMEHLTTDGQSWRPIIAVSKRDATTLQTFAASLDLVGPHPTGTAANLGIRFLSALNGSSQSGEVNYTFTRSELTMLARTDVDTKITIQAGTGRSAALRLGYGGTDGVAVFQTQSNTAVDMTMGGVGSARVRFQQRNTNAVSLSINSTDGNSALAVDVSNHFANARGISVWQASTPSTGNMIEVVSASRTTIYSGFDKGGFFFTNKNAAPADADLSAGQTMLWFDSTNGAAKLMVKAKQADGTVRTGSVALA